MSLAQVAIAAYLLLMPLLSVAIDQLGGHDLARIAQVALGGVCAVHLYRRSRSGKSDAGASRLAWLVIAALALAATLQASDPTMAAREPAVAAAMIAIALVVLHWDDAVHQPTQLTAIASAAYVAMILLVAAAGYAMGQPLMRAELFVGYDNYRFFNHVQTAALPLAVLAMTVAARRSGLWRIACYSAVGGFALLFTAAGRGTLVGILAGAVVIGALFGRASFATLRNLGAAAALGLVLFALLFWLLPLLAGIEPEFSDGYYGARMGSVEARFFLWRIALSYIAQSPWLGIGPMHYAHFTNPEAAHPHNVYLQVAAEWGVPMLLLLAGLGLLALRKMALAVRACTDLRQRDCGIGLFMACVAIAVDGLFSGNFVMPVSQVWIAFTFGWAMAWMRSQGRVEPAVPTANGVRLSLRRIGVLCLLVSQLWLVWSVWPEARRLDDHIQQIMERVPNATMNPRFWSHGWF